MNLNKKLIKKANLGITAVIVIGILAVANFFSYQIFYRWDLTQNKDYSISKASKNTVGELDDVVNIKAYFSEELPSQYITLRQEVGDILEEYANYSNGKIKVEFIDPGDDEDVKRELYMIGIPELQFNVVEKDKFEIAKGYLGIAVEYGGKTEAIPVVQSTQNLEYQITLAIKKVAGAEMAAIGFVTSNSTADVESEISAAYGELEKLYQIQKVDLALEEYAPVDVNTLIILGPKEAFNENQLQTIDAFLMRGGSLLIAADGVNVEEGLTASANDTGLNGLLENYGVKLNNDLVLDISSAMASFTQGFMAFSTNYPFWLKILPSGFDQDNAAVANLESLIMPWASSVEILPDKINKDNKVSYVVRASEKSWIQQDNFNLNPQQAFSPSQNKGGKVLAASIIGKFTSPYGNGSTDAGRLIVVGDSDFIKDSFLRNMPDNLIFFQNLVDSLSLDEDLINIRSKGISERPIKELSDSAKAAARYLNIFGVTVIVVIFGMARYYIRRRSRFMDEL
ncbi:MAG: GldG family protein [Candidatus Falkowbacteria bacterium]